MNTKYGSLHMQPLSVKQNVLQHCVADTIHSSHCCLKVEQVEIVGDWVPLIHQQLSEREDERTVMRSFGKQDK